MEIIETAYEKFSAGSQRFCRFIESNSGMGITCAEVERIANIAPNSSAFLRIWNDENWWMGE